MIILGNKIGSAIIKMLGINDDWKALSVGIEISKDSIPSINLSIAIDSDTFKKLDAQLNANSK